VRSGRGDPGRAHLVRVEQRPLREPEVRRDDRRATGVKLSPCSTVVDAPIPSTKRRSAPAPPSPASYTEPVRRPALLGSPEPTATNEYTIVAMTSSAASR
jgi:hypothetical protein